MIKYWTSYGLLLPYLWCEMAHSQQEREHGGRIDQGGRRRARSRPQRGCRTTRKMMPPGTVSSSSWKEFSQAKYYWMRKDWCHPARPDDKMPSCLMPNTHLAGRSPPTRSHDRPTWTWAAASLPGSKRSAKAGMAEIRTQAWPSQGCQPHHRIARISQISTKLKTLRRKKPITIYRAGWTSKTLRIIQDSRREFQG